MAGVVIKFSELVDVVLEVFDESRWAVFDEEVDEVESLDVPNATLSTFFQLLFLSLSQMNTVIFCC